MWRDSETEVDFLDFDCLINIINDTINDDNLLPSSIGVYGDWGSGKSSLMKMCKKEIEQKDDKSICLYFNSWLFESYDDAKTAILGTILDEIKNKKTLTEEGKDILKALFASVDKFSLIKKGSLLGLDLLITGGLGTIAKMTAGEVASQVSKESGNDDKLGQKIKDKMDYKELREDIREFREKFAELIEKSEITKLVVFIDELDRCSPSTVLDVFEAIRLFLFKGKVSFVIGADERHIRYAIKTKFKDIEGINMDIGKEYQEKLIQYPIRIPRMNAIETEFYIICLLIQEKLNASEIKEVLEFFKEEKEKDFLNFEVKYNAILKFNSRTAEKIKDEFFLAKQLSLILAEGLNGNPRQCKRFLNELSMRLKMAKFKKVDLKTNILAKIMEIEYFRPLLFKRISSLLSDNKFISELEKLEKEGFKKETKLEYLESYQEDSWIDKWIQSDPKLIKDNLSGEELKRYFYFMRNKIDNVDILLKKQMSEEAYEILKKIKSNSEYEFKNGSDGFKKISDFDKGQIINELYDDLINDDPFDKIKMKRILILGGVNEVLSGELLDLLNSINGKKIKLVMIPFFKAFYEDCTNKTKVNSLLKKWGEENSNMRNKLNEIIGG